MLKYICLLLYYMNVYKETYNLHRGGGGDLKLFKFIIKNCDKNKIKINLNN